MDVKEKLKDFSNWEKITEGFYRFEVGDDTYIEILLTYFVDETDILKARAILSTSGKWCSHGYASDESCFWRNFHKKGTVQECLDEALRFAPGV